MNKQSLLSVPMMVFYGLLSVGGRAKEQYFTGLAPSKFAAERFLANTVLIRFCQMFTIRRRKMNGK